MQATFEPEAAAREALSDLVTSDLSIPKEATEKLFQLRPDKFEFASPSPEAESCLFEPEAKAATAETVLTSEKATAIEHTDIKTEKKESTLQEVAMDKVSLWRGNKTKQKVQVAIASEDAESNKCVIDTPTLCAEHFNNEISEYTVDDIDGLAVDNADVVDSHCAETSISCRQSTSEETGNASSRDWAGRLQAESFRTR